MVEINVLFNRPYNEKDATVFLIMFVCMVVIFIVVKGAEQCGKN